MSETDLAPAGVTGAGAMLRAARENAGVHIASLAVTLKVPVARLEALEAERFDLLPDPPFVRALAGSVCRALKLDPVPVLALLPQKTPLRLDSGVSRTEGASFRTRSSAPAGLAGIGSGLRHPVVWVVVILLLAAAGLMFVPSARLGEWMQSLAGPRSGDTAQPPVGGAPEAIPAPVAEPPVAALAPMGPESPTPAGAAAAGSSASVDAAAPASQSARPQTAPVVAADAAATGVVSFSSTADSWVRVSDGRGATVFEKVLKPGAPQSVNVAPPLNVVVGNAGATAVQVRGQAFDLSSLTRNNVARFEVK